MMLPDATHSLAALAFQRLLYCVTAGTALVFIIAAVLNFLPARNSQTRFVVWFSALLAVMALPFMVFAPQQTKVPASPHALFTISVSWAEYIVLAWAVLAACGLMRVAFGLWQLRRLRRSSVKLDWSALGPETQDLVNRFGGLRRVSLLVSSRVEVPAAIGFVRPAIILPAWMIEDRDSTPDNAAGNDDLKYILLHELAHLRRWDDWTNLAQKLVKSILFFHPGVLWIERKLALDREMACDDAVLAQAGSPRNYAQCLTHVAEKSFLRRQIALAQAAVSRMKQLSRRVAWILNGKRSHNMRVWKPAIPLVAGAALLCGISASSTTELVSFSDVLPATSGLHTTAQFGNSAARRPEAAQIVNAGAIAAPNTIPASLKTPAGVHAVPADLKYVSEQLPRHHHRRKPDAAAERRNLMQRASVMAHDGTAAAKENQPRVDMSAYSAAPVADRERAGEVLLVIVTHHQVSGGNNDQNWQVSTWELYFYVPAHTKQVPRKT
jgi:beta-lactamase regulating signal transducer with metallopeptidase domain